MPLLPDVIRITHHLISMEALTAQGTILITAATTAANANHIVTQTAAERLIPC